MKKVIFFDFFGVISTEVAVMYFKDRFDDELAKSIKDKIFVRADAGEISEEETYKLISKETGDSYETVYNEWMNLPHIQKDMVAYIEELRKDHKVYLLSNAISSYLRNLMKKHNLERLFDKIYISAEIKKIKPNHNFFQHVIDDLKLNPSDCVMIDDNAKNIEGATSIGINGIVYKNLEDLRKNIENLEK